MEEVITQVAKLTIGFKSRCGEWTDAGPWSGDLTNPPITPGGVAGQLPPTQPMIELPTQVRTGPDPQPMLLTKREFDAKRAAAKARNRPARAPSKGGVGR